MFLKISLQASRTLLAAGQAREGYTGAQQQADIARFNFMQNQPTSVM